MAHRTDVVAAVALLCLSLQAINFVVPQAEPVTRPSVLGAAPALSSGWEPEVSSTPEASSAKSGTFKALALSAAMVMGCARGMRSRVPMRNAKTPDETYGIVIGGGEARLAMTPREILLQGIVTGFYIGFGGVLCSTVGGSLHHGFPAGLERFIFGAVGFPLSIFLTTVAGGQGFTPNLAVMATALYRKGGPPLAERWGKMAKNLAIAYAGNAIGLITIAYLANLAALPAVPAAIGIGTHKCEMTFTQVVFRGILGGWLIGLAVWTAQAAQSVASKFITIWLCISTYVVCQYEHCLANIFFVPCAIFAGAPITWSHFITASLIPSTIGNMIGGLAMLSGFARSVFGPKAYADEQKALQGA